MTGRERILRTLEGKSTDRAPQQLWTLPWALNRYPKELEKIKKDFPDDFFYAPAVFKQTWNESGNPYEPGEIYTDAWGCKFRTIQRGVFGEVTEPLVRDDDWGDAGNIHIPEEWLSFEPEETNRLLKEQNTEGKFVQGGCLPRPFEQLQFIRGTEGLFCDLMYKPKKFLGFLEKMHDFYVRLTKKWAQTDCDMIPLMDDWGSQQALLINPKDWKEIFRPLYRDYIDIAHKAGKKVFMHSDGYTLDILPPLIDMGLDAVNTQIFCIGIDKLKQFKGKITFWGEIDRQRLLPDGTKKDIQKAVESVYNNLYDNGYCIAQCEFGAGANPDNVYEVFAHWQRLTKAKI